LNKDSHKIKYFKELNALRFIGFVGIFFGHVFFSNDIEIVNSKIYSSLYSYGKILGFISIDSFFVLSSFLITWKGLEELKVTKKFQFKNFLIRRSLRIWPLYFLVILLGFLIEFMKSYYTQDISSLPSFWSFILFILNFDIIKNGYEFLFFMVFMWSISVEEQFYIFWALVLKWFQNHLLKVSLLIILISIIFRIYFIDDSLNLNFHTVSALGNFGVGALAAIAAFNNSILITKIRDFSKTQIVIIYLISLLIFIAIPSLQNHDLFIVIQRVLFSFVFAFIILEQTYCQQSIFKLSRIKYFNFFGKISYGLYCYHGIMITIVLKFSDYFSESLFTSIFIFPTLIFCGTLLFSHLSYKFFESKILKLKTKYTFKLSD
jgi:peptidoglycan/LPS O-acetylase OafA/YrhL